MLTCHEIFYAGISPYECVMGRSKVFRIHVQNSEIAITDKLYIYRMEALAVNVQMFRHLGICFGGHKPVFVYRNHKVAISLLLVF